MKLYDDQYVLGFFSSHTFIFKSGGLDQAIKVSGHVYVCRVLILPLSMIFDWILISIYP